jgi:hypothetical protein
MLTDPAKIGVGAKQNALCPPRVIIVDHGPPLLS